MNFWQSIRNSSTLADYEACLERYPNGTFAPLARTRAEALKSEAATTVEPQATPSDVELAFWDYVKDSGKSNELEAYIAQYPNGAFVRLAEVLIREGREQQSAQVQPSRETEIQVTVLDEERVTVTTSRVLAGPSSYHETLTILDAKTPVTVTGQIGDGTWYRVMLPGGNVGFVYGELLVEATTEPTPDDMRAQILEVLKQELGANLIDRENPKIEPCLSGYHPHPQHLGCHLHAV